VASVSDFAFSSFFCGYSVHQTPYYADHRKGLKFLLLRLQVEGESQVLVEGNRQTIVSGDLLFYRPGEAYELNIGLSDVFQSSTNKSTTINSLDYFLISSEPWIIDWWSGKSFPTKSYIGLDEGILSIWRQAIYEHRKVGDKHNIILYHLVNTLFYSLVRVVTQSASSRYNEWSYLPYQMKWFIEENATEPLTLQMVADHVNLSVSRTSQLFKISFNQSIMDYVTEVRMKIIQERMLYTGASLKEIAETCGFQNYNHFCRSFRSRVGVTPSRYRSKHLLIDKFRER
jgi:AraC family transcriptional regulator of arabinose operon